MASVVLTHEQTQNLREEFLQRLSQHPIGAGFMTFSRQRGMREEDLHHSAHLFGRKYALQSSRRWKGDGIATSDEVPWMFERRDALEHPQEYNDERDMEREMELAQLMQRIGPRPAYTRGVVMQLMEAAQVSFLSTWIDGGLMGPFTLDHVASSDEKFYQIYRDALERRIAGKKVTVEDNDLLACVSYTHMVPSLCSETVHSLDKLPRRACAKLRLLVWDRLRAGEAGRIFLWVDQACKGRRAESEFDWLSEGLMPYSQLPVLKVCGESGFHDVEGRLWPKVELTMGLNGAGVHWADTSGNIHELHNVTEHAPDPNSAVAAACRLVLCGYADNLQSFWEEDFRRLQIWSVSILQQDKGPRRSAKYQESNKIRYRGSIQLSRANINKLLLETMTMNQMMPHGSTATFRLPQNSWAAWTGTLPLVELSDATRGDSVFFCSETFGIVQSHRYFAVQFAHGDVEYVGMRQSETPNGEVLVMRLEGGEVKLTKVNIPGLDDKWSNLALRVVMMKMDGATDSQCVTFCKTQMMQVDFWTAQGLQEIRHLRPSTIQGIEPKTMEQIEFELLSSAS